MNNRIRYTVDEVMRDVFYQMPKFLFMDEFKKLNNDARVLYSVLKDRHQLSIQNQWYNKNNEIYLIFSRENMCELLGLSEKTVIKAMNSLKKYNLIEEERVGLGKPNKIYLLSVKVPINPQNRKICGSGLGDFAVLDLEILQPNNTEINNTEDIDNEVQSMSYLGIREDEKPKNDNDFDNDNSIQNTDIDSRQESRPASDNQLNENASQQHRVRYTYDSIKQLIYKNIDYDFYTQHRNLDIELVDELMECMLDVICTNSPTVKINGENKDRQLVINQYLKINSSDIDLVLVKYKEQQHKITHIHNYLKTCLYHVKQENGHFYTNAVRVDGVIY